MEKLKKKVSPLVLGEHDLHMITHLAIWTLHFNLIPFGSLPRRCKEKLLQRMRRESGKERKSRGNLLVILMLEYKAVHAECNPVILALCLRV